jgi:hypothetical protein
MSREPQANTRAHCGYILRFLIVKPDGKQSNLYTLEGERCGAVDKAPRHKPKSRGIDSRWCHWNFSLT